MKTGAVEQRFLHSSPYWPVLTHPQLRRVLPGLVISAVGDGMSVVAISWLALQLAPGQQRGIWVAIAVAAYTLPSAAGGVLLGRFMSGRGGAQLAGWNATLRAVALAAIAVVYATGQLNVALYVTLLAISSLLAAWGSAGRYTLIAELLPTRHHLPANAVITTISEFATIVGPPLAGILISWTNAARRHRHRRDQFRGPRRHVPPGGPRHRFHRPRRKPPNHVRRASKRSATTARCSACSPCRSASSSSSGRSTWRCRSTSTRTSTHQPPCSAPTTRHSASAPSSVD